MQQTYQCPNCRQQVSYGVRFRGNYALPLTGNNPHYPHWSIRNLQITNSTKVNPQMQKYCLEIQDIIRMKRTDGDYV
jgi:hypothetical protein